jgi:hypothetical protein
LGYGDEIIASGQARGYKARGRRAAFGDGKTIIWHHFAYEIFQGNPNVAPPGHDRHADIQWVANYRGNRPYNTSDKDNKRWNWIPDTIKSAGELFFTGDELRAAHRFRGCILVEPNVPHFKPSGKNKQWPVEHYQLVVDKLVKYGFKIIQPRYQPPFGPGHLLKDVEHVATSFRQTLANLSKCKLYLGPEGGLHHGAAAVGTPAVVLFGAFVSPKVTGYSKQRNFYSGDGLGCGSWDPCEHCFEAMQRIRPDVVLEACEELLNVKETV